MNNFSWPKALGFGVLLWVVMFILASIAVAANMGLGVWTMLILAVIAGLLSYGFAVNAEPSSGGQALGYGVIFAAIGLLLDFAISYQWQPGIFSVWTYWLGYALVLLAPFTAVGSHQTSTHSHA